MPVPNSIDELKPNPAENFPIGSEAVFPNLDNYMRFLASCIAQLRDRANAEGLPMGQVLWWGGARAGIPARMAALDGQLLNRVDFPELWTFVSSGGYPIVTEAEWQASPTRRASFSSGNGTTTFRTPDLNGRHANSIGSVSVRGDGAFSAGNPGLIQDSQNLSHGHGASSSQEGSHAHNFSGTTSGNGEHSHNVRASAWGSFGSGVHAGDGSLGSVAATNSAGSHSHSFSGSTSAAGSHVHAITIEKNGGSEARMKAASGAWIIRAK